jgi:predicted permease
MHRDAWHTNRFTDVLRPLSTRLFPPMAVLKPGMSMREAEDRLNAIVRPLLGAVDPAWRMSLVGVQEDYTARIRPTLVALVGGAVFLLLIAGASVAGAQTARAVVRRAEIQIRTALGASRGRIIAQLLTESLVIAAAAATIGVVVAGTTLATFGSVVGRQLGAAIPGGSERLALGPGLLIAVVASGCALGAVFGLLPALTITRGAANPHGLGSALGGGKGTARSAASPVLRRGLIVTQVAFTMMLLIGAGLMGRTVLAITTTPLGFTDEHVVKGDMFLPSGRYPDAAKQRAGAERVLEAVTADPAMRAAALSFPDPFRTFSLNPSRVITERGQTPADSGRPAAGFVVTPSYFAVMEIPVLAGRAFAPTDDAAAPRVVVVSQRLAGALWPNESAVGRRVRVVGDSVWATVVGVVGEIREPVEPTPMPEIYWHLPQDPVPLFTVLARVAGDPAAAGPALQRAVARADNLLGMGNIGPLSELADRAMRRHRALATVLSLFALLALGLAMLGLYASLAYLVAQRRREIAIRVAVGANAWAIRSLVLREGVALVGIGLLLGVALSLALTRLIASQLYGVTPTDPGTFGAIVGLLGASALVASLAPIRQATRVQPAEIMRGD